LVISYSSMLAWFVKHLEGGGWGCWEVSHCLPQFLECGLYMMGNFALKMKFDKILVSYKEILENQNRKNAFDIH